MPLLYRRLSVEVLQPRYRLDIVTSLSVSVLNSDPLVQTGSVDSYI